MYVGLLDYRQYVETTTILQHPDLVRLPADRSLSIALLAAAALVSLRDALRGARARSLNAAAWTRTCSSGWWGLPRWWR